MEDIQQKALLCTNMVLTAMDSLNELDSSTQTQDFLLSRVKEKLLPGRHGLAVNVYSSLRNYRFVK